MLSSLSLAPRTVTRAAAGLLAAGLTVAGALVLPAPAQAARSVEVTKVTVTSESVYEWSLVGVAAEWTVHKPAKGDVIKISLGEGLQWHQAIDFNLTALNDPAVKVGDCKADYGKNTLTCVLNDKVTQWDSVVGTLTAKAQMTSAMVGKDSSKVTANGTVGALVPGDKDGDGTCDADCGPVRPEQVSRDQYKNGWLRGHSKGTYTWTWSINTTGATSYTVLDPTAEKLDYVVCTPGSTWDGRYNPEDARWDNSTRTLTWTARAATDVCRAFLISTSTTDSASNTATVNGQDLSATAKAESLGDGSVDGSNLPPAPASSQATGSAPTGQAASTGAATGTAGAAGGAPAVGARSTGTADPGDDRAATAAGATASPSSARSGPLASTGVSVVVAGAAGLAFLGGAGALYVARRQRS